jgi:hypothetical protein
MGAFGACTSGTTHTTGTLADGSHTIFVKGSDAAGNSDTKSSTFTVDTVAPTVMFTSQPNAQTNDNTATVTFTTGGSPTAIDCQVDGGAFSSCGSSFTTNVLADGAHSIGVRVTDAATNTTTITANFTVDTVGPVVNITSGPRFGYPTDENPQTFGFSITGAASSNCKMDGGTASACTTTFTSGTLAAGTHTFTITATDAAGNVTTALATNDLDPKVMCLDGTTDRGDATVTGLVNNIDASTIEFWYRSDATLAASDLVDFDVPSQYPFSTNDSEVRIHFTGTITGDFQLIISPITGAASTRTWDPGVLFDPGIWHHYAFVMTGTTQKLFIDGVENMTGSGGTAGLSFVDAFGTITNPVQLHVGVNGDTTSSGFTKGGLIDLRISSTTQYSSSFTVEYPHTVAAGTVLLYGMLEGAGMTSSDEVNPTTHVLTWTDTGWATGCF